MTEGFKVHAWKSDLFTRADAHEIPPTHSRSTTSRNIDTRRHVLVNHRVDRGFEGVCDTVLTQRRETLRATSIETYVRVRLTVLVLLHAGVICMDLRSASLRDRRHWNAIEPHQQFDERRRRLPRLGRMTHGTRI